MIELCFFCIVSLKKFFLPSSAVLSETNSGELHQITWVYPIKGFPELTSLKEMEPAIIATRARERTEERFEVVLSAAVPSNSGPKRGMRNRQKTPTGETSKTPEGIMCAESESEKEFNLVFSHFFFIFIELISFVRFLCTSSMYVFISKEFMK